MTLFHILAAVLEGRAAGLVRGVALVVTTGFLAIWLEVEMTVKVAVLEVAVLLKAAAAIAVVAKVDVVVVVVLDTRR